MKLILLPEHYASQSPGISVWEPPKEEARRLVPEIHDWCIENCICYGLHTEVFEGSKQEVIALNFDRTMMRYLQNRTITRITTTVVTMTFENDIDAIHFKMRWW
jgi:hypothetical protein